MRRKYLILFSLSGLILTCDQLTKHLVNTHLKTNQSISVIKDYFAITYFSHSGFAFGLLKKAPPSLQDIFFIGIPVFALILIVLIFIKLKDNQMLTSVALTTILAGAIGNLTDRIRYGHVIDFIDFHLKDLFRLPPFNIADFSIIIGVFIMFVNTFTQKDVEAEK